jgi:hypothetical protein
MYALAWFRPRSAVDRRACLGFRKDCSLGGTRPEEHTGPAEQPALGKALPQIPGAIRGRISGSHCTSVHFVEFYFTSPLYLPPLALYILSGLTLYE